MKLLKSFTNFSVTINFVVLTIIAEWIKIPQVSVPLKGPQDTLMLSNIPGIPDSPILKPIRYEDLEHIIGPGFEDELEKFYEKHQSDLDTLSPHTTTSLPEEPSYDQYNETIFNEDPWSYYDQLHHTATIATTTTAANSINKIQNQNSNNKNLTKKPNSKPNVVLIKRLETTTTTTGKPASSVNNNNGTRKKIMKIVKVKQKPKDSGKTTSLSFSGFLKFLKDIQSSFVFGASRSLTDKITMLANFRDTLLINIGI